MSGLALSCKLLWNLWKERVWGKLSFYDLKYQHSTRKSDHIDDLYVHRRKNGHFRVLTKCDIRHYDTNIIIYLSDLTVLGRIYANCINRAIYLENLPIIIRTISFTYNVYWTDNPNLLEWNDTPVPPNCKIISINEKFEIDRNVRIYYLKNYINRITKFINETTIKNLRTSFEAIIKF